METIKLDATCAVHVRIYTHLHASKRSRVHFIGAMSWSAVEVNRNCTTLPTHGSHPQHWCQRFAAHGFCRMMTLNTD